MVKEIERKDSYLPIDSWNDLLEVWEYGIVVTGSWPDVGEC